MKLANAIEGGITGATTLTLLQEMLHKIDKNAPRPFLHQSGIFDKLRDNKDKKFPKSAEPYLKLAAELLTNVASYSVVGLGKKKNAPLRGAFLGTAAGLVSAFLLDDKEAVSNTNGEIRNIDEMNGTMVRTGKDYKIKKKVLTVLLYAAGGLLAGTAVKEWNGKNKKWKRKLKLKKLMKGKW